MLETLILPYDLHVNNKTNPTHLNRANNTESFIDCIITDRSLISDTVICDIIVKSDHLSTLSMLGLLVETKQMPNQKTLYSKKNYNESDIKHCLEQKNWKKVRSEVPCYKILNKFLRRLCHKTLKLKSVLLETTKLFSR